MNIVLRHAAAASCQLSPEPLPEMPDDLRETVRRPSCRARDGPSRRRMPDGGHDLSMRVWRGDADGGDFVDYTVPVEDGEVVLDVIHRIQATQAPRPRRALELQGRQVRLVQRRGQRQAAPDVHDAHEHCSTPGETDHRHADADVPGHQGSRHRRLVQLRDREEDPAVQAASRRSGRHHRMQQEDIDRGAGVPQVHRVLPLPERLPRHPRPRREQGRRSPGRACSSGSPSSRCTRSTPTTGASCSQDEVGLGYCNITKCCTEVCPEHIKITDNAIIPLKERVVDDYYDPLVWLGRKIRRRGKDDVATASRTSAVREPGLNVPSMRNRFWSFGTSPCAAARPRS